MALENEALDLIRRTEEYTLVGIHPPYQYNLGYYQGPPAVTQAALFAMTRIEYANKISPELVQPIIDTTAQYTGAPSFKVSEIIFSA